MALKNQHSTKEYHSLIDIHTYIVHTVYNVYTVLYSVGYMDLNTSNCSETA